MGVKSLPRIKKKLITDLDSIFCAFMFYLDNVSIADLHRLYYRKSIQYTKGLPRLQKLIDDVDSLSINWLMLAREANIAELPEELEPYIFHSLQRIYENSIRPYTEIISKLETIYHKIFSNYALLRRDEAECIIDFSELDLIKDEVKKNKLLILAIEEKYLFIKQKLENKDDLLEYEDELIDV